MPAVLERINSDQLLATAALANPILALEELGYELAPELRRDIVRRARFPRHEHAQLSELLEQIDEAAGRPIMPDDPASLERLLFEELHLPRPDEYRPEPPPRRRGKGPLEPWNDPLEVLRGRHPVMEPLLAYRTLDAKRPPLADADTYTAVRTGRLATPVTRVRGRLQSDVA